MLLDAQKFLKIDMSNSYMVGDKLDDMLAGRAAEVGTTVLVRTGKPVTEDAEVAADMVINSIADLPALLKPVQKAQNHLKSNPIGCFICKQKKVEINTCVISASVYNAPSLTRSNTLRSAPTVEESEKLKNNA